MKKIILLVVLALGYVTSDRVYESECPEVTPMHDFDMNKVRVVFNEMKLHFQFEKNKL